MIRLARKLKRRYRSYLLSNTDEIHLPWCLDRFSLGSLLDGMILSYEIGAMKPDRAMYEHGLGRFALKPEECVFIDDLPANLEGARSVGIATVKCDSPEQVERDLAVLGVRV
jgi:putative hydrolase of the HAD superfamily